MPTHALTTNPGKMAAMAGRMKSTALVSLAAFASSAAAARLGPRGEVLGLPLPLAAAAGFFAVSAFGGRGQYDEELYELGNGTLAAYVAQQGAMVGAKRAVSGWHEEATYGQEIDEDDEELEEILRAANML